MWHFGFWGVFPGSLALAVLEVRFGVWAITVVVGGIDTDFLGFSCGMLYVLWVRIGGFG